MDVVLAALAVLVRPVALLPAGRQQHVVPALDEHFGAGESDAPTAAGERADGHAAAGVVPTLTLIGDASIRLLWIYRLPPSPFIGWV